MNRDNMKHPSYHHHDHQGEMEQVPQGKQTFINVELRHLSDLPEEVPGLQTRIPQIPAVNT